MISSEILRNSKHIHFIGIGGSGMYPLVQILHEKGFYITGSDNNETETLEAVRKMGITVFLGQRAENIEGADLIVYTAAIMEDNPELVAAKASGAAVAERAEMLGLLTGQYSNAVCVCGTHGKTTATSMITQILLESGKDISCFIGGKLPLIGGSGRSGSSDTLVCEACEFRDHFLQLYPDVAVILNVDADHLEYFKNIDNIIKSFRAFAEKTEKAVIYNGDDANTLKALEGLDKKMISFGFGRQNDYSAVITGRKGLRTDFELYVRGEKRADLAIHVPGDHNVLNALAAAAAAELCGADTEGICKGLDSFTGALRRFQKIDEVKGVTIVDDYAHHPAELACTLTAAKSLDFKRVWAVFQPFTYSRTKVLLEDFVKALSIPDIAVITDIMGGREKNTVGIYTEDLAEKIEGAVWFETDHELADKQTAEQKEHNFAQCVDYIAERCQPGDLVITLGCGDAYKAAKMLAEKLRNET